MDDLAGLGKLADSRLVNAAYKDIVQPGARETGKAIQDVTKAFRLFTAPLQLLAVCQDRLSAFCDRARSAVPVERQIEAAPSIAIPIMLALRYMEDDNLVTELFVNLLTRCIDRSRVGEAHPAFPRIIEQLAPDEAMILYSLREREHLCIKLHVKQDNSFPFHRLAFPNNMALYCHHLDSLNLLHHIGDSFIEPSVFGTAFIKACVPDEIDGMLPFRLAECDSAE